MARIFNITGNDTLVLWDRVFNDLADESVIEITYPENIVEVKTGKNQNTIYAKDEKGNNVEITLRVMRGSDDDIFLDGKINDLKTEIFPKFKLAKGTFTKMLGDGEGNLRYDTYNLEGGIFTKLVDVEYNVNGNTDQAVSVYKMKFALAERSTE